MPHGNATPIDSRPISLVTDAAADRAQIATMITDHNTLVTSPPRPTQARKSNDDGTTTPETPREHALTYLPQCARCHQQIPWSWSDRSWSAAPP